MRDLPSSFARRALGLGVALVVVCAIAAVFGSYLAAKKVISVRIELLGYFYLVATVVVGTLLCWAPPVNECRRAYDRRLRLSVRGVAAAGTITVLAAWLWSDRAFMYWTLRSVSPTSWAEMAAELRLQGVRLLQQANDDHASIGRDQLPAVLDQIGRREEFVGGNVQRFSAAPDDVVVWVLYGYKGRRWGLCLGATKYGKMIHPREKGQQVAEGLSFVIAPE
jgi:hypothetical protein